METGNAYPHLINLLTTLLQLLSSYYTVAIAAIQLVSLHGT